MKKPDTLSFGLIGGLVTPLITFALYFSIRDPQLKLVDQVHRLVESKVISYYLSLCAGANLALFLLFLRFDAERAARGVLGATILYAFAIILLNLL